MRRFLFWKRTQTLTGQLVFLTSPAHSDVKLHIKKKVCRSNLQFVSLQPKLLVTTNELIYLSHFFLRLELWIFSKTVRLGRWGRERIWGIKIRKKKTLPKTPRVAPRRSVYCPVGFFSRLGSDRLRSRLGLLWNFVGGAWVRGSPGSGYWHLGQGQVSLLGPFLFQRVSRLLTFRGWPRARRPPDRCGEWTSARPRAR